MAVDPVRRRPRLAALVVPAAAAAGAAAVGLRLRSRRRTAWPPPPDGLSADQVRDRAAELLATDFVRRHELAVSFAPSKAANVEPLLHGRRYFPRMLEDIAAAKDHIHLLIYGIKEGDIGRQFLEALAAKVRDGVEVRLAVDAIGSEIDGGSRGLYKDLLAAGIEVVAHEGLASVRTGPLGARTTTRRIGDFLHFDHRKMAIFDGRVGYVGGSGIEDHYNDERFYDVMARMEGPVVAQLALLFVLTWRHHDAQLDPANLERYFPSDLADDLPNPDDAIAATVLGNVPGTGHHPISDVIEQSLAAAQDRIDIVNPYISNKAILAGLLAAAQRGVTVRLVAPGKPTPPYAAAAFRHAYPGLLEAGATILLHPEMAHAKVLRIDDRVLIGGCNLDDLSLFRNHELDVLFEHSLMPDLVERTVFEELVGMSNPASASTAWRARQWERAMYRVSRFL